ncbi:MAG: hypothetical protein GX072_14000 [Lysinibacillus sp.]|nr:hypothetical protein [Lysinibacillus sp.]
MLKEASTLAIAFFIISSIVQFIFQQEVQLFFNLGSSFAAFLLLLLFNWANVPYLWKKDKEVK